MDYAPAAMTRGSTDAELFGGAPFLRLFSRVRLARGGRDVLRRVGLEVAIAWLPLVVLTIAQGTFLRSRDAHSFLLDIGAHSRFLLALPLLTLAGRVMATRLTAIAHHFVDVEIVTSAQRAQFDAAVASTHKLVHAYQADTVIVAVSYAIIIAAVYSLPLTDVAGWHLGASGDLSWAGWWHALVSLPMLLILLLAFVWRWCLWTRLLWLIAKLDLALVPAHPDAVAGLSFVSYSVRSFALHGLSLGVIFAGAIANRVLYEGAAANEYLRSVIGLLVFVVAMFHGPLLVFSRPLMTAWRRGVFRYGALADRLGREFEDAWLSGQAVNSDTLSKPDFSATTDLYSVVGNIYRMRPFLFDLNGALLLVVMTAVPFLPVALISLPLATILSRVVGVLL